jgi:cystathionine gamma-synthase
VDPAFGAVMPPLYLSSNFTFEGFGWKRRYDYTRSGNPTRDALASAIAELEGAAGGVVTSSGLSAVALCLELFEPGSRLVAPHDAYGGTLRLLKACAAKGRFELRLADQTDLSGLREALDGGAEMVWIETPSNPLLRITDIAAVTALAHRAGALAVVDNTFLSPALQRPIALGADLVVHSTTKYLNGHSDVVGGAVVAADSAVLEKLAWWGNALGVTGSPFDSFLTLRGIRTLFARMRIHEENARAVADFLEGQETVKAVHYPGLESHGGHALASKQQQGFGGMVSFELADLEDAVPRFLSGLKLFSLAESLGGVESLVAHPATMTHASVDAATRAKAGIGGNLLRLSVGIEEKEDLLDDLALGLARVAARGRTDLPARRAPVSSPAEGT